MTQRTREIGVLKSIGATRRSILSQFLLEAMAIVTGGGAIGVAVGWALTSLLGTLPLLGPLFHDSSGAGDIHLQISTFAVLTSTLMLATVGLIAGLLPAIKAARLDPIEVLRYDKPARLSLLVSDDTWKVQNGLFYYILSLPRTKHS